MADLNFGFRDFIGDVVGICCSGSPPATFYSGNSFNAFAVATISRSAPFKNLSGREKTVLVILWISFAAQAASALAGRKIALS